MSWYDDIPPDVMERLQLYWRYRGRWGYERKLKPVLDEELRIPDEIDRTYADQPPPINLSRLAKETGQHRTVVLSATYALGWNWRTELPDDHPARLAA